jgi:phosphatidylserine/phosphatidylglycerophosphate/cardiolipin synthase-like enzyme
MNRSRYLPSILFILLLALLVFTYLDALERPRILYTPPRGQTPLVERPPDVAWYSLYFTEIGLESYSGGPDERLEAAIAGARQTIDIAAYDLNLWGLRDALIDAQRRGVVVRMVLEVDNFEKPEVQALVEAGIPIVTDDEYALMHNKIVIIDRYEVWTGSMNFTLNGAYKNDNNLLALRDPGVTVAFQAEFDELFAGRFGGGRETAQHSYEIEGTMVEVWFSPDDGIEQRLLELLEAAERSILFMAFSFTTDSFAEAMLAAQARGLEVSGIFDESQAFGSGSEYEPLLADGLDVYLDGNPAKLHHKVIIIDSEIVITGSYNFSKSAETRNDENLVILFSPEIVAEFEAEFARVAAEALP